MLCHFISSNKCLSVFMSAVSVDTIHYKLFHFSFSYILHVLFQQNIHSVTLTSVFSGKKTVADDTFITTPYSDATSPVSQ